LNTLFRTGQHGDDRLRELSRPRRKLSLDDRSKLGVSRSSDACMQCHAAKLPGRPPALGSYWLTSVHAPVPNGSHTARRLLSVPQRFRIRHVGQGQQIRPMRRMTTTTIGGQPSPRTTATSRSAAPRAMILTRWISARPIRYAANGYQVGRANMAARGSSA